MAGTLGREVISTRQRKIAELAQRGAEADPDDAGAPHRRGVDARSLPANPQGRGGGCGRSDGGAVRGRPGGEPDGIARTVQVRSVSSAGGAPGALGEAGDEQDTPDRHPDAGGQNPPARGADGDGGGVRAGLSGLLVRIPARAWRSPSAASSVGWTDEARRWLGHRPGHRRLLRKRGLGSLEELSGPTGARRSDTTSDREVVERRSDGGGRIELSATGSPTRGRAFPDTLERLSA